VEATKDEIEMVEGRNSNSGEQAEPENLDIEMSTEDGLANYEIQSRDTDIDIVSQLKQKLKEERRRQRKKNKKQKKKNQLTEEIPLESEVNYDTEEVAEEEDDFKDKSFDNLESFTTDVKDKVEGVGSKVTTGVERLFDGLSDLIGTKTASGELKPTIGFSFGLPQAAPGYGGYPTNPVNSGGAVNPYYTAQQGLELGPVNVNPLVSLQAGTTDTGDLALKPLVNLHLTPNGCGLLGCTEYNDYGEPTLTKTIADALKNPFGIFTKEEEDEYRHTINSDYTAPSSVYPPGAVYGVPSSNYVAPSSGYGAPSSEYGAPSTDYGVPDSNYGAPTSDYGPYGSSASKPSYRPSSQSFGGQSLVGSGGFSASSPDSFGSSKPSYKPSPVKPSYFPSSSNDFSSGSHGVSNLAAPSLIHGGSHAGHSTTSGHNYGQAQAPVYSPNSPGHTHANTEQTHIHHHYHHNDNSNVVRQQHQEHYPYQHDIYSRSTNATASASTSSNSVYDRAGVDESDVFKRETVVPNSAGSLPANLPKVTIHSNEPSVSVQGASSSAPASFKFPNSRKIDLLGAAAQPSRNKRQPGALNTESLHQPYTHTTHRQPHSIEMIDESLMEIAHQLTDNPKDQVKSVRRISAPSCGKPGSGYVCCKVR